MQEPELASHHSPNPDTHQPKVQILPYKPTYEPKDLVPLSVHMTHECSAQREGPGAT